MIELDPQVAEFVRSLAPEPRRRLRAALRGLAAEAGDLKQLEADLTGYARLRAGSYCLVLSIGDTFGLEEGADERHIMLDGAEVLFDAPA